MLDWDVISTIQALCFIRVSKPPETIKAFGLRPLAFISFSVFGCPDETLALVVDILYVMKIASSYILLNTNSFASEYGLQQFFLPILLLLVLLKIQQIRFPQSVRQSRFLKLVDQNKNHWRIFPIHAPLDGHVQLFPAEIAGEVVVRQNNQHLAAAIHAVRHVLDDGYSQLKVPDVNAVGYRVLLKKRNQILSDPGKVLWTVTDENVVACNSIFRRVCIEKT